MKDAKFGDLTTHSIGLPIHHPGTNHLKLPLQRQHSAVVRHLAGTEEYQHCDLDHFLLFLLSTGQLSL